MKKVKITALIISAFVAMSLFVGCGAKEESAPSAEPTTVVSSEESAAPTQDAPQVSEAPLENVSEAAGTPENISPTTGMENTTTTYKPVMVQIDNSTAGRKWQTGLQQADVVYESRIEIDDLDTRLTALFNDALYKPDAADSLIVGAVRSSRYYHQWIASEWDPLYVHVGGPDKTNNEESDIWGASDAYIHQRINGAGTHAVNTDKFQKNSAGDKIEDYAMTDVIADAQIINYEPKARTPFKFYPLQDYADQKAIETIKLAFGSNPGWTEYKYDAATDKLTRIMSGTEVTDKATDQAITVQNLIVQYVPYGDMPGDPPRAKMDVFGSGPAEFIIHGKHLQGTWERAKAEDATIYKLDSGEEVTLAPGNTWIAMHPNSKPVEVVYADGTNYKANAQ